MENTLDHLEMLEAITSIEEQQGLKHFNANYILSVAKQLRSPVSLSTNWSNFRKKDAKTIALFPKHTRFA